MKISTRESRIVRNMMAAPAAKAIQDAQRALKMLDGLSDNIEDSVETFSLHFRVAAVDVTIGSQMDLLRKSKEGLNNAKAVKQSIERLLRQFPEDKTAQRVLSDSDVMIKRFMRHEAQARKVISAISKKQMPPALKKYVSAIARIIKSKFEDPSLLKVTPWQSEVYKGGINYEVLLWVKVDKEVAFGGSVQITLAENTNSRDTPGVESGSRINTTSPKEAAASFLENLRGWDGLKGGAEAGQARGVIAEGVASAINSAISRLRPWMKDDADIENGQTLIRASYRSDLPKDGKSDVGEYLYRDMVNDEISKFKGVVEPMLNQYKNDIKDIRYYDGEKSWIFIEVELK